MEASSSEQQDTFKNVQRVSATEVLADQDSGVSVSVESILSKIFGILNSPRNHREPNPHKSSISIE